MKRSTNEQKHQCYGLSPTLGVIYERATPAASAGRQTIDSGTRAKVDVTDIAKQIGDDVRKIFAAKARRQQPSTPTRPATHDTAPRRVAGPRTLAEVNRVNEARWRGGAMQQLDRHQIAAACDAAHPAPIKSTADMNRHYAAYYSHDNERVSELDDIVSGGSDLRDLPGAAPAGPGELGYNPSYTQRAASEDENEGEQAVSAYSRRGHGGSGNRYGIEMSGIGSLEELNRFNREYYSPVARAAADRRTLDAGSGAIRTTADMARYYEAYYAIHR